MNDRQQEGSELEAWLVQPVPLGTEASYPVRGGNHVRPLVDGIPAFARIGAAIQDARKSVWLGVAFIEHNSFIFPGLDGSAHGGRFWDLLRNVSERGVEVRLLFWSNKHFWKNSHFQNSTENREWLDRVLGKDEHRARSNILIRWDQSDDPPHCHHEKSFLIDAGCEGELAFIGGIGMSSVSMVTPEHRPCIPGDVVDHHAHDIFFELQGPSATDVHHHFVQRWNGALGHHLEDGHWPSLEKANHLPYPSKISPSTQGNAWVQVQRSVRSHSRGGYSRSQSTVLPQEYNGPVLDISGGEQSIFEQYKLAFAAAKRTIYIENQHVAHPLLLELLLTALKRGVDVFYLAPTLVMRAVASERDAFDKWIQATQRGEKATRPRYASVWEKLNELSAFDNFVLAGLAVANPTRRSGYQFEYVHSKVAIVDGEWYTGGSANLVDISMEKDHTELNISVWDKNGAHQLLAKLCSEHTGAEVSARSDVDIIKLLQRVATSNAEALKRGGSLQGHAFALDPLVYGRQPKSH